MASSPLETVHSRANFKALSKPESKGPESIAFARLQRITAYGHTSKIIM